MAADPGQPPGARRHPTPLAQMVEREARRVLAESQLAGDPQLLAEGWERRFVADQRRAEEALELYRGLGFEVRAEPVRPEEVGDDCSDCRLVVQQWFVMIYTRRPNPSKE